MSEELSFMEANQRKFSYRGNFEEDPKDTPTDYSALLKNITIYDLIKAFKKALLDRPAEPVHQIKKWNITIDEQMEYITAKLEGKNQIGFVELMLDLREKIKIVVTFIAVLEMVKAGKIGLRESYQLNDFFIYGLANG